MLYYLIFNVFFLYFILFIKKYDYKFKLIYLLNVK